MVRIKFVLREIHVEHGCLLEKQKKYPISIQERGVTGGQNSTDPSQEEVREFFLSLTGKKKRKDYEICTEYCNIFIKNVIQRFYKNMPFLQVKKNVQTSLRNYVFQHAEFKKLSDNQQVDS